VGCSWATLASTTICTATAKSDLQHKLALLTGAPSIDHQWQGLHRIAGAYLKTLLLDAGIAAFQSEHCGEYLQPDSCMFRSAA
jgi:hypothetical protein